MTQEDYALIPQDQNTGITNLLSEIRPVWKGRNLIHRVTRILPVDPSSACQRLFNAAIHDLKEKIIVMGVDLAKQVAANYRLPSLNSPEDVLEYNVSKTIDLAYRMGLLTRGEWRRIHRCYEIRRDLEHEDNEYEAVIEDCFYIFKSAIDIVLSKDPIELLKVTDAKQLIEMPINLVVSEEFLENYKNAPQLRQTEITELLVSYAFDETKPDIVRQNSIELMRHLHPITPPPVTIDIAKSIEARLGNAGIDLKTAKIGNACGAIAYFKKVRLRDFYATLSAELNAATNDWEKQGKVAAKLEDIGGLVHCPNELYDPILRNLVLFYIGEPSYGKWKNWRSVFYSNSAAPIISRIISGDTTKISSKLNALREDEDIAELIENTGVSRRFESLVDLVEEP